MIVNKAYFYCPQCGEINNDYHPESIQLRHPIYDRRLDKALYLVKCKCSNCLAGYTYASEDEEYLQRVIQDYNRDGWYYSEILEKYLKAFLDEETV